MSLPTGAHVTIDLGAITHNLNTVRRLAPGSKIMAIVKANAYGHGATEVAECLIGTDSFGVARTDELMALRSAGIDKPVTLLEGFADQQELQSITNSAPDLVIHADHQVGLLQASSYAGGLWIKVDVGMNRLGFAIGQLSRVLKSLAGKRILGIMTHLPEADDGDHGATGLQIAAFVSQAGHLGLPLSIANSAGILAHPASRVDWVRPGLMLYGASPFDASAGLKPAMQFTAPVIAVKNVRSGEKVGYGGAWVAPQDCRIAILAVGYADGYPREMSDDAAVVLNGQRCPLTGRVSMDMMSVLLGTGVEVSIGDRAVLWGGPLPIEQVAQTAGTIAYTLMCGIGSRVSREYVHA